MLFVRNYFRISVQEQTKEGQLYSEQGQVNSEVFKTKWKSSLSHLTPTVSISQEHFPTLDFIEYGYSLCDALQISEEPCDAGQWWYQG